MAALQSISRSDVSASVGYACACLPTLQARAAASGVSEACSILGLLVGMAQRDRKASERAF